MAATYTINFVGGPCDGQTRDITGDQLQAGAVTCKGVTYVRDPYATPTIRQPWPFAPATDVQKAAKANQSFHPAAVAAAWHKVTHALSHGAPRHIRRQQAANARLRRLAR
jgi:hypothetical protein